MGIERKIKEYALVLLPAFFGATIGIIFQSMITALGQSFKLLSALIVFFVLLIILGLGVGTLIILEED